MALLEGPLSVLNAYAMATGGDTHGGRTQLAMENAFGRISEQARYQYVLGYVSNQPVDGLTGVQRKIEVKIPRPGLRIRHRQTYMQFPAPR